MRPDLRQPARQPTLLHCADRHTTTLWDLSRQIVAYWCAIANRTSQVRAQRVQHERTFFQGLEHQSEVELLEIAKSTVEQLGLAA
jgi:hypothetical protein